MKKARSMDGILCNLVMDEMSIKKAVELVNDGEYEYVDIADVKDGKEAGDVLVVMVVCENGKFKIPVSHYFIQSLSGEEKAQIVTENLHALHDTGITITSLTFDSLQSNTTMCNILGAKSTLKNDEKFCFPHPVTHEDVYVIYDGCHALKLIRNALASGVDTGEDSAIPRKM